MKKADPPPIGPLIKSNMSRCRRSLLSEGPMALLVRYTVSLGAKLALESLRSLPSWTPRGAKCYRFPVFFGRQTGTWPGGGGRGRVCAGGALGVCRTAGRERAPLSAPDPIERKLQNQPLTARRKTGIFVPSPDAGNCGWRPRRWRQPHSLGSQTGD